jgi:hypothetical protein
MADYDYKNVYGIQDYRDVLNLAFNWKSYWQRSKIQMINGFHWYHKEIPIVTPKQVEPHVPSTATTLVNDAADHLSGNDPTYVVKPLRESQRADEDKQRIQTSLNAAFDELGHEYGHPIHRVLAIDGGWSGMMCAKVSVKPDWDPKNPVLEDIRWQPQDPRWVYPDPGTLGKQAVIIWMQQNVGLIRQQWPDWQGHWFPNSVSDGMSTGSYASVSLTGLAGSAPMGGRGSGRLPKPLNDNDHVTWVEYWDGKYKCFIANGFPVFTDEYGSDLIEHGLGCVPFCIRSSGYGTITGDTQHRFKSMLANVFSELDTEAALLTQLKWIVQETAWPIYLAPKDTEGEFDLEPGSLNFIENPESIKAIRTLREDAIEPKAIIELLDYIKQEIEKATYPRVLKGESPAGIRAGYPIAILSSQAKLKFASPTDALKGVMLDLALKTMEIVKYRFKVPMAVIEGYKLKPEDYDTYVGRISVKLEPQLPQDLATKLPILEFLYGSIGFPAAEVMRELGYEHVEEMRELRMAENLEMDPRVQQVLVEHLVQNLLPDAAAAVDEIAGPSMQMQKMQQSIQELQGQIQMMQMQKQIADMQNQGQAPPGGLAGTDTTGAPQFPPQAPGGASVAAPGGPAPGGPPIPIVPGGAGGSPMGAGQNPGQPSPTQAGPMVNPQTALAQQARNQSAMRQLTGFAAQKDLYGTPSGGVE